ncbi:hypothetical protein F7725_001098 [Dissostichus mawsoni]|uniref:C2H2-type domain-containing protein n=1 Tax=Dissostichus mawsoni TaxID=36200 RepID=A0A7J5ZGU1_DISMA|nr:hypothetical protein F7725_001098 [Dissostichus mawsoni]
MERVRRSLCSLLWHGLAHLSLPVFSFRHCALCFVQRCMLDRHMAAHAEEAVAKERERLALRAFRVGSDEDGDGGSAGVEELHCFLPAREVVKMSNLGLGMDELQLARYVFSRFHPQPALGGPDQRGAGQAKGVGAAGVRGK